MFTLLLTTLIQARIREITILGTNDAHGKLMSDIKTLPNGESFKYGGLSLLSSYINILRKQKEAFLWLDAGDQYTGTLESQFFNGSSISEAFNYLGEILT